jgi:hypothetical protein
VVDHHMAGIDHLADNRDVAIGHGARGAEGEHGTSLGFLATGIGASGIAPPIAGIARKLHIRNLAGIGHALEPGLGHVRQCSKRSEAARAVRMVRSMGCTLGNCRDSGTQGSHGSPLAPNRLSCIHLGCG